MYISTWLFSAQNLNELFPKINLFLLVALSYDRTTVFRICTHIFKCPNASSDKFYISPILIWERYTYGWHLLLIKSRSCLRNAQLEWWICFYIIIFHWHNINLDQITLLWSFGAEVRYTSFLMKFVSVVKLGVRLCEVKCNM